MHKQEESGDSYHLKEMLNLQNKEKLKVLTEKD